MGDLSGKSGIDKSYESILKGEHGKRFYTVDHRNRRIGNWKDGAHDLLPVPGKDLTSSIDLDLQLYGEQLMSGKRGSIVAIEPESGEILAMVTAPNYDPNELSEDCAAEITLHSTTTASTSRSLIEVFWQNIHRDRLLNWWEH